MDEEKRKAIRVSKPLSVQFGIKAGYSYTWDMSLVKDISETGICIRTGEPISKDEICYLRLRMPTHPEDAVEVTAKVVDSRFIRGRICNTRLEFFNLTQEQQELLHEFVAYVLAQERGEE